MNLSSQETEQAHNSWNFVEAEIVNKLKSAFYQSMEAGDSWLLNNKLLKIVY